MSPAHKWADRRMAGEPREPDVAFPWASRRMAGADQADAWATYAADESNGHSPPQGPGPIITGVRDPDRYAASLLDTWAEELAATPEGRRDHTLNRLSFMAGQWVGAGHLDAEDVIERMTAAGRASGQTAAEVRKVARSVREGERCPVQVEAVPADVFEVDAAELIDTTIGDDQERAEARKLERATRDELRSLKARTEARLRLAAEQPRQPFDAALLGDLLLREPSPPPRVECLIPARASSLILAPRKAGKTIFELNLAKALATGEDFLGRLGVRRLDGIVALLNFEVDPATMAGWAEAVGVPRDRLLIVNLRDRVNPFRTVEDTAELAAILRRAGTETVIADPHARCYPGDNENETTGVTQFLTRLDVFTRTDVGATDLIYVAHTGWSSQERVRGSSALEGWADSMLNIVFEDEKDVTSPRYVRAFGRDVEFPEEMLTFDPATRRLGLTGGGSRREATQHRRDAERETAVLEVIGDHQGCNMTELRAALQAAGVSLGRREELPRTVRRLEQRGLLLVATGPNNAKLMTRTVV